MRIADYNTLWSQWSDMLGCSRLWAAEFSPLRDLLLRSRSIVLFHAAPRSAPLHPIFGPLHSVFRFPYYLLTIAEYHPTLRRFLAENGVERVMFSSSLMWKLRVVATLWELPTFIPISVTGYMWFYVDIVGVTPTNCCTVQLCSGPPNYQTGPNQNEAILLFGELGTPTFCTSGRTRKQQQPTDLFEPYDYGVAMCTGCLVAYIVYSERI